MSSDRAATASTRARVLLAFAAIYLIWGSTYLAIRIAIESLPPFLMAGTRFLAAGGVLYAAVRLRGEARPSLGHWKAAAVIGALFLLVGNGGVVWAEQRIPSGLVALTVATVPLWTVLLAALPKGAPRPGPREIPGVLLGLLGLAVLVGPGNLAGSGRVDPLGVLVVTAGAISWSFGSLHSRSAGLPDSPFLATAMEMLTGGAMLLLLGLVTGEAAHVDPATFTLRSLAALTYLAVFGSLVALTAFVWLLGVASPTRVSTYAYVNPVIAVLLGWALGGESLGPRTLLAAAVIVGGVLLIIVTKRKNRAES